MYITTIMLTFPILQLIFTRFEFPIKSHHAFISFCYRF